MAIEKLNLLQERTEDPYPRIRPDDAPGSVVTRTFTELAQESGADRVLAVGTPMVLDNAAGNTGQLRPWVDGDGGTRSIVGFVYPRPVTVPAANEKLGVVMMKGKIHVDDVVTPTGQTLATLQTALKEEGLRYAGLVIDGLAETL